MRMTLLKTSVSMLAVLFATTFPLIAEAQTATQTPMLDPSHVETQSFLVPVLSDNPIRVGVTNPTNRVLYFSVPSLGVRIALQPLSTQTVTLDFIGTQTLQIPYVFSDSNGQCIASGAFYHNTYYIDAGSKLARIIHYNDKYQKSLGPEPRYTMQNVSYHAMNR